MPAKLKNLTICGFKTIRELRDFQPGPISVLIGANGAGKSNFLSFFRLLSWMFASPGDLQHHVAISGGAQRLLHNGPAITQKIQASLNMETDQGENEYQFGLSYAADDTFVFAHERYRFRPTGAAAETGWTELGAGQREAKVLDWGGAWRRTAGTIPSVLRSCLVYHLHNTSPTARIRGKWQKTDNRWLKEDAGNLAPFLLRLREEAPAYYRRIVENVHLLVPFFADFELDGGRDALLLQWREHGSDLVFDVSQASDGSLRAMALVTLLLQPEEDLPAVLILDEPELGLHPYAIDIIAGLLRAASNHTQVIVATQSAALVNCFEPEDVVVVSRSGMESTFERQSTDKLDDWLDDYSLAELWEKNVIGGRPGG